MSMNHTLSSNNACFDLRIFQFFTETSSTQLASFRGLSVQVEFIAEAYFFSLKDCDTVEEKIQHVKHISDLCITECCVSLSLKFSLIK